MAQVETGPEAGVGCLKQSPEVAMDDITEPNAAVLSLQSEAHIRRS